ncbi:PIN-like domain-containing protein [Micromonospora chalcea]|uniref:PIN-like domain-containing protein n=1 Tax=Micromonospora chalcea TaxID=1874 RepID=UPI00157C96E1|nr:PIN-like domain-containing protein [Micromonospora chalcea]
MVVLDTNVLLSAYRFAPLAREQLLSAMERLKSRLWIPHRVAFEFHRRRLDVIVDQRAAYESVLALISRRREELNKEIGDSIRQLSRRAALTEADRNKLLEQLERSFAPLAEKVNSLNAEHSTIGIHEKDPILSRLQAIIGDSFGEDFGEQARDEALAEAERRKDAQIPPGFKDASKDEFYGDYFLWRQTLDEASIRSAAHLLFVTSDQKEDWYLKVKGKHIAHPMLTEEVQKACGAQLVLISTETLLRHARRYLDADVSNETIRQAGELRKVDSIRERIAFHHAEAAQADGRLREMHAERSELMARVKTLENLFRMHRNEMKHASPSEANRHIGDLNTIIQERDAIEDQLGRTNEQIVALEDRRNLSRTKFHQLQAQLQDILEIAELVDPGEPD